MYPPSPNWISKLFDGGKGAVIAGVVFGYWLGQTMAKGDKNHWHDIARQFGNQWQDRERHADREHDTHGRHTEREHERRQHRHGEGHDR
jgi:hypothetical protein